MRFAVDTGGTFTDLIVEDDEGGLHMFKASTTPSDPIRGVIDALEIASGRFKLPLAEFLGRGSMFIYGTTHALNAVVTGNTARTAFLTTQGHPDILTLREGGRADAFDFSQPSPEPYVPRALTWELPGRMLADGSERTPLDEAEVLRIIEQLRSREVEAVAVCLLWSIANPAHELRVGELLQQHLPGVPFTLSHRLNPTLREYRRASSTCIDASLKPMMAAYMARLSSRMREAGFRGRTLVITSQGGVMDGAEVADAPISLVNSGPSMAPVSGRYFAMADEGTDTAIVADTGGTTYDVSLVRRGTVPWTRESWIGPPHRGHMTGFASVPEKAAMPALSQDKQASDGVRLALLSNRFEGIARKMSNTLLRSSRSGVINMAGDFSCCIVTAGDELLAAAESLPIHVLSGPDLMAGAMRRFHPQVRAGDAFLHNSPYHGCSHPADHTILVPVIDDEGVHRYTVLAKAHQADCGNSQPTTYMGSARDVYEEGALIFPAVKVQQDYRTLDDIVRMCEMRIRVPAQWRGDFLAMLGAARIGERELLALGKEIGWDRLAAWERDWFDYSERRMAAAIRAMPAGHARRVSVHDALPGMEGEGIPIGATVTVKPREGRVEVDLRDNPDCIPAGLNLSEACARTAAMVGVFNSIEGSVPKNAGSFRRLSILLRENCIAGIPLHPTSCSVATTNIADRVANAVQGAIAEIAEGFGLAECGGVIPAGGGVVSGRHPATGQPFVNQVIIGVSGGAAAPHADAWQLIGHVGNAGKMYIDSVELDELRQPLYVHERRFIPDTEGAGRQRGASSVYAEFGPLDEGSLSVAYGCDGAVHAAQGVRGGLTGSAATHGLRRADGRTEPLPAWGQVSLQPGERIFSSSCGGGGYGAPAERDPAAVARDVAQGWITPRRARAVYRVQVDETGRLDADATRRLRIE